MLINFQKIRELTFDGFDIVGKIEATKQQTTKVDFTIIRNDGYKYKTKILLPTLSADKTHIIYNNIVYANPIIAIPPLKFYKTFLNTFDYLELGQKEGSLISIPNENQEMVLATPLIKACFNTDKEFIKVNQSESLENLDNWYYCRISDFVEKYFMEKLKETIKNLIEFNNFNSLAISKSIIRSLILMRYVGHVSSAQDWKIEDLSSKVRIPNVFRTFKNAKSITSSFLDFTNCSQSKTFNEFSLKGGVKLDG